MTPIAAFAPRPALRQWCYRHLECAAYASPLGHAVNGYVLIPADSPLLPLSGAHDIVAKAASWYAPPATSGGYDAIQQLITDIHGGMTYGADEQGWVGFDTAHAWDHWDQTWLTQELIDADDQLGLDTYARMQALWAMIGRPFPNEDEDPWTRHWTMDLLMDETNHLAALIVEADQVLRQVRKIMESS